jgi:hypothetical protein
MNPVGALILAALMVVVLLAPRRWALLGMMAGVLYLTEGVAVQIGGFNMYATRFLELAGFVRVMSRREFSFSRLNKIDRIFLLFYIYSTVVFMLRSSEDLSYQVGVAVDAFLCYFTFRGLIGEMEDFRWFLRAFAILLLPYVGFVAWDSFTHYNIFTSMGGIEYGDWTREGRLRCQGSFRHPSLMGTLGACFLPLFIGVAFAARDRARAMLGILLCVAIVVFSNSGGPLSTAAMGIVGWLFWRVRTKMQLLRRGIAGSLLLLALVMKAPIWYLLARISAFSGGDGWHRSYLIDMAWQHLGKWWLAGMPIEGTGDWFPYDLGTTGQADITNQFIAYGLASGLVAMILFIVVLVRAFSYLGKALNAIRNSSPDGSEEEFLFWGLGVMLLTHIVNWLGITYFDQISLVWFLQLAAISNLSEQCLRTSEEAAKLTHKEEGGAELRHEGCSQFT